MNISYNTIQSEPQFREKLKLFSNAKPRILTGYLIVKKDGSLGLTNLISKLWQSLKGAAGYCNFTNSHLIQLKTLQFFAQGKEWIKQEDKNLITKLALRAGLISDKKNIFSLETVEDDLTRLVTIFSKELKNFSPEILKIKTSATILQAPILQTLDKNSFPQANEDQSDINDGKDSLDKPTLTSEEDHNQKFENLIQVADSITYPIFINATSDAKQPVTTNQDLVEPSLNTKPLKAEIITSKTTSTWAGTAWKVAPYALLTMAGLGAVYGLSSLVLRGASMTQEFSEITTAAPIASSAFPFNFTGLVTGGLIGLTGLFLKSNLFQGVRTIVNDFNRMTIQSTKSKKKPIEIQTKKKFDNVLANQIYELFENFNKVLQEINNGECFFTDAKNKINTALNYFNFEMLNQITKFDENNIDEIKNIISKFRLNTEPLEIFFNSEKTNLKNLLKEELKIRLENNLAAKKILNLIESFDLKIQNLAGFNIQLQIGNQEITVTSEILSNQEIFELFLIKITLEDELAELKKEPIILKESKIKIKDIKTAIKLTENYIEILSEKSDYKILNNKLFNHKSIVNTEFFKKLENEVNKIEVINAINKCKECADTNDEFKNLVEDKSSLKLNLNKYQFLDKNRTNMSFNILNEFILKTFKNKIPNEMVTAIDQLLKACKKYLQIQTNEKNEIETEKFDIAEINSDDNEKKENVYLQEDSKKNFETNQKSANIKAITSGSEILNTTPTNEVDSDDSIVHDK